MKRLSSIAVIVFLAFVFVTCDEHGGRGGSVSEIIGPEGGTITSRDGKLTLTFPPGALSEDTEITIKDINPGDLPSEFDGFDSQFAYVLEPDGIEFNVPVTASFLTDEEPVQDDGSLSTEGALLLTSLNGEIEVLENLAIEINGDSNTTTSSADLNHFSFLRVVIGDIGAVVSGLPDKLAIDQTFMAEVSVFEQGSVSQILEPDPLYEDISESPIARDFEPAKVSMTFIGVSEGLQHFKESLRYKCTETGEGLYASKIGVNGKSANNKFMTTFLLLKTVECVPAGTPIPTPAPEPSPAPELCAKVGTYQSAPPPTDECGIGSFILNINTDGEIALTGFKDNPGDVIFNPTDDPAKFFSASNNLTIFGVGTHSCDLMCGPGVNMLTLKCERVGAMCTEVFTLQQ